MAAAGVHPVLPAQRRAGAAQVRPVGMDDAVRVQRRGLDRVPAVHREAPVLRAAVVVNSAVHGCGGAVRRQGDGQYGPPPVQHVLLHVAQSDGARRSALHIHARQDHLPGAARLQVPGCGRTRDRRVPAVRSQLP